MPHLRLPGGLEPDQLHRRRLTARIWSSSLGLGWSTVQAAFFFMLIFLLWEAAVRVFGIKPYLLPPPTAIMIEAWQSRQLLFDSTIITLAETLLGFTAGVITGSALAV